MKLFCRFILIIFMFCITLGANAFCIENNFIKLKSIDAIYSYQNYHHDILNSKDSGQIIEFIQKNDTISSFQRKNDNRSDGNLNKLSFFIGNIIRQVISYNYNKSFLDNKSKVNFSVILSSILPNAP